MDEHRDRTEDDGSPDPDAALAADLWLAADRWDKEWRQKATELPELLYHYTDAAGLLGIVESGSLWASHSGFVNDSREIHYVNEVIDAVLAQLRSDFDARTVLSYLDLLPERFNQTIFEDFELYLACFSEHGDQLSQWRGYGSSGEGYAVGVRSSSVSKGRVVRKVVYGRKEQEAIVRGILAPRCQLIQDATDADLYDEEYLERTVLMGVNATVGNLGECSWSFKHPGFEEEAEYRLVVASPKEQAPQFRITPKLRVNGAGLLPYTTVALAPPGRHDTEPAIAEVVIGPNAHHERALTAVRHLLSTWGYAADDDMVRISGIPLRT